MTDKEPAELSRRRQFNRPRNPSNADPNDFNGSPAWVAPEIQLDDNRILVLEST